MRLIKLQQAVLMEDQARAKRNEKKRKKQLERETRQIMTNLVEAKKFWDQQQKEAGTTVNDFSKGVL